MAVRNLLEYQVHKLTYNVGFKSKNQDLRFALSN